MTIVDHDTAERVLNKYGLMRTHYAFGTHFKSRNIEYGARMWRMEQAVEAYYFIKNIVVLECHNIES